MALRKIPAAALAVWLCSPAASAEPESAIPRDPRELDSSIQFQRYRTCLRPVSRDLIATYQGQPERHYDAMCAVLSNSLKDPEKSYHYRLRVKETLVCSDLAVVRLVWTLTVARKDGRATETVEEPASTSFAASLTAPGRSPATLPIPSRPNPPRECNDTLEPA